MSKLKLNKVHKALKPSPNFPYAFGEFLTSHPLLIKHLRRLEKVSSKTFNLLLVGETGTGKELIARAVHNKSPHRNGPFIPVNCGAIPDSLVESELFGHEPGAFTDAKTQKRGIVELAHGGTLFLDEIGDMPLACQMKLLRFIESKDISRLGGTKTIHVDCQFISATNKNLSLAIKNGEFREDLYYRIGMTSVEIPPLRSRKADILLLGQYFLKRYAAKHKAQVSGISRLAWGSLLLWHWTGNVRELESVIEEAVALGDGDLIELSDLPILIQHPERRMVEVESKKEKSLKEKLNEVNLLMERQLILEALERNEWNMTNTASALKISRSTLYRKISEHQIERQA